MLSGTLTPKLIKMMIRGDKGMKPRTTTKMLEEEVEGIGTEAKDLKIRAKEEEITPRGD